MFTDFTKILEAPFVAQSQFRAKEQIKFKIKMENYYLNSLGRVYKLQKLNSEYMRTIEAIYEDAIMYVSYTWHNARFENRMPKKESQKTEWTFIKDKTFQSHIILSNEKLEGLNTRTNLNISREDHKNCLRSIEKEYSLFPKLPSSYLVVMQTFDILAFETYLSYIHSYNFTNNGWELDKWIKIQPQELEHMESTNIGLGMYSNNSFFKNGKFNLKFTGYGKAHNKYCAIFDYYCDYSQVKMQDKDNPNVQRNGTSYYHGQIWINLSTGDLERGTMQESYIALQEGLSKKPINIRRKVLCETIEGEEANSEN